MSLSRSPFSCRFYHNDARSRASSIERVRSRRDSERDTRQRHARVDAFSLHGIPRSAGLRTGSAIIPRKKPLRKAALRSNDGDSFRPSGRTAWRARGCLFAANRAGCGCCADCDWARSQLQRVHLNLRDITKSRYHDRDAVDVPAMSNRGFSDR